MVSLELLSNVEVFKGLAQEELEATANICVIKEFKEGDTVFSKDALSSEMFILSSGRCDVKISVGGPVEVYTIYPLNPGDIFGELGFINGSTRSATVKCIKDVEAMALSREKFAALCGEKPRIGYIVMKNLAVILAERLRETDKEFKNFYSQKRVSFRKLFPTG
ncbi:cyclic nucleotide-binding domain-containing protein [candidate division WOR-3 bacterium]|nr:cyclic nucleotide-binding domain-containing protein [candidate division WOR-3 bacterium]